MFIMSRKLSFFIIHAIPCKRSGLSPHKISFPTNKDSSAFFPKEVVTNGTD